jgi:predicted ATPase
LRPLPGLSELDVAVAFLRDRRALLVIDNCEHLAEAVARVSSSLLEACPSLSILATSRVPLAIRGEMRWCSAAARRSSSPARCARPMGNAYARALGASDPPPLLRARALAAWAWIVGSAGDFGRANALAAEAAAAAGLTNPEIAQRLFIARATVKTHLSHVYAKLSVHNRSQLAVQAAGRLQPRD